MRRNRWPGSAKISELRGAGVSRLDRDSEGGGSAMRCSRLTPVMWSAIAVLVPLPRVPVRYGRYGRKRRKSR